MGINPIYLILLICGCPQKKNRTSTTKIAFLAAKVGWPRNKLFCVECKRFFVEYKHFFVKYKRFGAQYNQVFFSVAIQLLLSFCWFRFRTNSRPNRNPEIHGHHTYTHAKTRGVLGGWGGAQLSQPPPYWNSKIYGIQGFSGPNGFCAPHMEKNKPPPWTNSYVRSGQRPCIICWHNALFIIQGNINWTNSFLYI